MLLLFLTALLGPAETLAGKYVRHAPEFLELHPPAAAPLPEPLPSDVDTLCRLIEAGHETPELFAALGEALARDGRGALAYRAFDRAQALAEDPEFRRRMQERKDQCPYVPSEVIRREEARARFWVEELQAYERDRIARGEDPRDLAPFYARFGRPEEELGRIVARRRAAWAVGVAALLLGAGGLAAAFVRPGRLPRWAALLPLAVGAWCLAAPSVTGEAGLYIPGAGAALAGGLALLLRGRRRA